MDLEDQKRAEQALRADIEARKQVEQHLRETRHICFFDTIEFTDFWTRLKPE